MTSEKHCTTFPLRIPSSTRAIAAEHARRAGVSLNYFILVAISERVTRMEQKHAVRLRDCPQELDQVAQVVAINERS